MIPKSSTKRSNSKQDIMWKEAWITWGIFRKRSHELSRCTLPNTIPNPMKKFTMMSTPANTTLFSRQRDRSRVFSKR